MANIDVAELAFLLLAIVSELDEPAEVGRDAPRVVDRRRIERDVVVRLETGRRPSRLRHVRVGEGGLRGEGERQPVIIAVGRGVTMQLEVAPLRRELRAECPDMAVGAGLAGLDRERRQGERLPCSKRRRERQQAR
jgi:hypothetical protein